MSAIKKDQVNILYLNNYFEKQWKNQEMRNKRPHHSHKPALALCTRQRWFKRKEQNPWNNTKQLFPRTENKDRSVIRDGPLENLWGGAGEVQKKNLHKGKLNEKKFLHAN